MDGDELQVVIELSSSKSEQKAKKQKTLHFFAKRHDNQSSSAQLRTIESPSPVLSNKKNPKQ